MKNRHIKTPDAIMSAPYGFTYQEMVEVIGEREAKILYSSLYEHLPKTEHLNMSLKKVYKAGDTEKYVYEMLDGKTIETVFIKRRGGGSVCVSTQVGCCVGCLFC